MPRPSAVPWKVSRPAREPAANAPCPTDGAAAERIFTVPSMNFNRPAPSSPAPPSSGFSHRDHSHGPGTGHHAH